MRKPPAALVASLLIASCGEPCPQNLCQVEVRLLADLPVGWERLRTAAITACRNESCVNGVFAAFAGPPGEGASVGLDLGSGGFADGGAWTVPRTTVALSGRAGGTFSIDLGWYLPDPRNGDVYRVLISDGEGTILALDEKVAVYQATKRPGSDCPGCPFVRIDRRAPGP